VSDAADEATEATGAPAGNEVELAGSEVLVPADADLDEEMAAEQSLFRAVIWGIVIAIPVCMVIWIGMVALAVGGKDPDWWAWIGMGALVGVLAGAFFGGWAGFTMKAHLLDELDERASHH
jgi:hypothetical protein